MQYISPLSILGTLSTSDATDKKGLAVAKKKMLAELELNGGSTVFIKGKEFTKNDIVTFFDNIQQSDDLAYHIAVANDVFLLKFLENNTLENKIGFNKAERYKDPAFLDWVSPYFYTAFTVYGSKCIEKTRADDWITLMDNQILMNDKYTADAWDYFERGIRGYLNVLQSVGAAGQNVQLAEISALCDFNHVRILKKLPTQRFYVLMDEYAGAMMNAAVYMYNKGQHYASGTILDNAKMLAVSTGIKDEIIKKQNARDEAMHNLPEASRGGGNAQTSPWAIVRVVLVIVVLLLRIAACNSH